MMVEIEGLSIVYRGGEKPALEGVDLRVGRGELLLLTGHTGCGKTTLIRALAGLLLPEHVARWSGSARVAGIECRKVNRDPSAPRVGVLFQNPDDQIIGGTPREEIAFGLENYSYELDEMGSRIRRALEEVGMGESADEPVTSLSGGQKQRMAIAAVLALEPELVLLDEPTSNLDGHGRKQLGELLARLRAEGRTLMIASHDVRRLAPYCNRVALLEEGRLVVDGPTEAVLPGVLESLGGAGARKRSPYAESGDLGEIEGRRADTGVCPYTSEVVEAEGLRFRYRTNGFRLGPLSFRLGAGERVALFGPNGGGKTTLLSLLAGVLRPEGKGLRVCGIDAAGRGRRKLPRLVSLVTQNPDLMLHNKTVEREVGARPRYLRLRATEREKEMIEALADYELMRYAEKHPFSLSQGERQRLALAAAVSGGGRLLLVDEPTTGQDMRQRRVLLRRMEMLAQAGMTVVFSTHSLDAAMEIAERAMVIEGGELVFDGSMEELLGNERLLEMAGLDLPGGIACGTGDGGPPPQADKFGAPYTGGER
jgi:energy-coupling factor transporter ATP-binding protein EcfA2